MVSTEISILREKLDELRRMDGSFETFGSVAHRYRVEPPLTEVELKQFEAKHEVSLPEPYRTFVSELSNGGPGPYYGLFPLGYFDGAGGPLERWEEGDGVAGDLSKPFPHTESWNLPDERFKCPEKFGNDDEEESWYRALDDATWQPELVNGAFPICHQGCAVRSLLIVSGPERGNIWIDDRPNDGGIFPDGSDSQSGTSFFNWYLNWLDTSIAALSRSI